MQKPNYDKLQDSLEYIKMVCEEYEYEGCAQCPLGSRSGVCVLMLTIPQKWRIRHPETDVFRVLE